MRIDELKPKTPSRLRNLRRKYRELKFSSHHGGAGGERDSTRFKRYDAIVREIDRLLEKEQK